MLSSAYSIGWIIDSGALDHMCHDMKLFSSVHSISDIKFITIPDGSKATVTHIGTVKLNSHVTLHDVLFVPSFKFNLVAVPKLTKDTSYSISFTSDLCLLQDHTLNQPIVLGRFQNGLYYTAAFSASTSSVASTSTSNSHSPVSLSATDDARLLHLRMGHIPYNKLKHIDSSIDTSSLQTTSICTICPTARQHRKSFSSSCTKTSKPFEILHMDVWGPYKAKTYSGCNIFLTIVDDFSRATWIHFMKCKSDSVPIIQNFLVFVSNQFNSVVQIIRTDNAKELCEEPILQVYTSKGIIHQTSCVDTPQQNGVVERKHKHLLETARALQFQSKLPISYWGGCLNCAVHLVNRMPLKCLNFISPNEKLFGQSPNYSNLRAFGCLCFVSTSKVSRTKLDHRADDCVFLGYPTALKGYKVPSQFSKDFCPRDLVFHEKHFFYHYKDSTPQPFFLPVSTPFSTLEYDSLPDVFYNPPPSDTPTIPSPSNLSSSSNISPSFQPLILHLFPLSIIQLLENLHGFIKDQDILMIMHVL
ncbi:Retrovirus-related Pol polyprotein from transposon RE1 [Bienertia sinuspersici]